jgi:glutamate racemase
MGRDVVLVSSADETAFAVRELVSTTGVTGGTPGECAFLTSGDADVFRALGERFLGPEVRHVEHHEW